MDHTPLPRPRPAPRGLGTKGRTFWKALQPDFEFTEAEQALVLEAARCIDRLDMLDQSIRDLGPMVEGSSGQQVVNPALTEARGQQAILHRLIAALQLEDDDGHSVATARQVSSQTANYARWNQRKGRGIGVREGLTVVPSVPSGRPSGSGVA